MNTRKIRKIQAPNAIIINREFSHHAFALYVELRIKAFNNKVKIYPTELKSGLGWTDNRRLKKYLGELYDFGLIDVEFNRIDTYRPIECNLTPIRKDEHFTQVDVQTIDKIRKCTTNVRVVGRKTPQHLCEVALRLFYYYEKNYNEEFGKAFPTYEQINEHTRIHATYVKALNTTFHNNGVVSVEIGKYYNQELDDVIITRRAGNQYIPICIR